MVSGFFARLILLVAFLVMCGVHTSFAIPFSAETTSRESVPRAPYPTATAAPAGTPTATPIPQQLYDDSYELSFQKLDDGRVFFVYTSKDPASNYYYDDKGVYHQGVCGADGVKHVYWVDRASGEPAVCIDVNYAGGSAVVSELDASNPKIGGDGGDEGRYVAFESSAHVLLPPTPTPDLTNTPTATPIGGLVYAQQIYVHDRKWEDTSISMAEINDANEDWPNGPNYLTRMSRNGAYLLFSSRATNIKDSIKPENYDQNGTVMDVYVRNGNWCVTGMFGPCQTMVLYDDYKYHSGGKVSQLNHDSVNPDWNPDHSVIVFETQATVPIHFLPDLFGYIDIFVHEGGVFERISNEQVAVEDDTTGTVTVINSGSPANGNSTRPRVDSSGKYIVFESTATNLVLKSDGSGGYVEEVQSPYTGYKHIFLYNRNTEQATLISKNVDGTPGNAQSENPWISDDARFIIFESRATNLMTGVTTTSVKNIFVYDRVLDEIFIVSPGPNPSYTPGATPEADTRTSQGLEADATITDIAPNGLTVAYQTTASNAINAAVPGVVSDTNSVMDVFIAFNACPRDSDTDGVPDCLDLCPQDHDKHSPGQCGCGVADTDTDGDSVADCLDGCPTQPAKIAPGQCGCDVLDSDTDADGTADCVDGCIYDPYKTAPGACGCGLEDSDNNGNGVPDCADPTTSLVPTTALVRTAGGKTKATGQSGFQKVRYTWALKNSRTGKVKIKRSSKYYISFGRLAKGRYALRYNISSGSIVSQWSAWKKFRV